MYIRFPAPPGGLARSLTVRRSPVTGEVIVTGGPPLPSGPSGVWTPSSGAAEHDAQPVDAAIGASRGS